MAGVFLHRPRFQSHLSSDHKENICFFDAQPHLIRFLTHIIHTDGVADFVYPGSDGCREAGKAASQNGDIQSIAAS